MMRAIVPNGDGGVKIVQRQIPQPGTGEELMKVAAFGINRADILQVQGKYPPPPGTTDVLGLEASGYLQDGRLVSALLTGGGYAEYVIVPSSAILSFPSSFEDKGDPVSLAAIPEAFLAAYHILFQKGGLSKSESVLINAAASGVGTSAIQLASTVPNTSIIASAGNERKLQLCKTLGAHHVVNYKEQNISDVSLLATQGQGVDLVLDCVGAAQFKQITRALRVDGRWVMYGLLSGAKRPDLGLAAIVSKRLSLTGTTLRSRSSAYRGQLVSEFMDRFGDSFGETGPLRPVIDTVYDGLTSAERALQHLSNNSTIGKVVVRV